MKILTAVPNDLSDLFEPPTLNLPRGELVQVVAAVDADTVVHGAKRQTLYIVRDRETKQVAFYQAGDSPGSWVPLLYIQER